MSLKMKRHSNWKVAQNGMSLGIESHPKIKCHSKGNFTQNGISLKI